MDAADHPHPGNRKKKVSLKRETLDDSLGLHDQASQLDFVGFDNFRGNKTPDFFSQL
jgi:hypothetical protein